MRKKYVITTVFEQITTIAVPLRAHQRRFECIYS